MHDCSLAGVRLAQAHFNHETIPHSANNVCIAKTPYSHGHDTLICLELHNIALLMYFM